VTGTPAEQAPTATVGALPPASPSLAALAAANTELEAAIRVARLILAEHEHTDPGDLLAVNHAHHATREALRILLHNLNAEPDVTSSRAGGSERCPAAHPEDPTPCGGPVAVTILDRDNAGAKGCEWHAARLLASLAGGRVYPLPDAPEQAAIRVFKGADSLHPFPWVDAPRTRDEQLSRAEVRERGEGQ
jgi:hypothetical protein